MAARHETRRRTVLDVPDLAVGTNDLQLAAVFTPAEKRLPRRLELASGREEFVEAAAAQLRHRQAKEPARGWIGVDEGARVVDDEHGVMSGRDQGLGVLVSGQRNHDTTAGPPGLVRRREGAWLRKTRDLAALNPPAGAHIDDISYTAAPLAAPHFTHPGCLNTVRDGVPIATAEPPPAGY